MRGDLSGFCSYLDDSDIRSDLRTNNIKIPASAPSSDKKALDLISLYILFTHSQVLYNGAVCEDSLIYAYRLNVLTGLRTGEMMGLEWGDIDDDYIHVRRAINAKGVTTGGKNGYAKRDFPLTRQTRDVLKAQESTANVPVIRMSAFLVLLANCAIENVGLNFVNSTGFPTSLRTSCDTPFGQSIKVRLAAYQNPKRIFLLSRAGRLRN